MNRFKTGCIVGAVLMATGMALAQNAPDENVRGSNVAAVETSDLLLKDVAVEGVPLMLRAQYRIGEPGPGGSRAVTPGAVYSNITTFTGSLVVCDGVATSGTNRVTKLLADDIQCTLGGVPMIEFSFSVGNFNTAAYSCQPLIRFYTDDANTPGTYLGGWNFNAISFPASSVGVYYATVAPTWNIPANAKMWIGTAFLTTTGTTAQRNNVGSGLYNPVDVGSSIDRDFLSTANGGTTTSAFTSNSPAGTVHPAGYYGSGIYARYGYEVVVATGACCASSLPLHCAVMTPSACTAAGGTYLGNNSMCSGLDCNTNGIDDKCDLAAGTSLDCNTNGIPDECDIASGFSQDCQPDGIPDSCQLDSPPFVNEGFTDITTLTGAGWYMQNNSNPLGTTGWFQGDPSVLPAQAGPDNSYIAANFNNTGTTGTISNWLLTPAVTLQTGVKLTFYTRTATGSTWADRMQVRMSTNGTSTNVGATATSVGDFTTLLLDINPTYVGSGYPQTWAAGYYTITISGVPTPTTGRLAFRYFVENGGSGGANSNIIGIDTVKVIHAGLPTYDQNQNGVPDACDPGACCNPNGQCTSVRQSQCSGSWLGLGTTCTPTNPCPQPPGACCFPDGHCEYLTQAQCGGSWLGYGTTCTPNPCPQPNVACCFPDGSCQMKTAADCTQAGGTPGAYGTTCTPNTCPQPPGACCYPDGHCEYVTLVQCTGDWLGYGTTCTPNPCPQPPGACCFPDGHCEYVTQAQCSANWLGYGTVCLPDNPCPQPPGACCFPDGHCEYLTEAQCAGSWLGYGTVCLPDNPCPQPPGACCFPDGHCEYLTQAQCSANWLGYGTTCTPNPCPQPNPRLILSATRECYRAGDSVVVEIWMVDIVQPIVGGQFFLQYDYGKLQLVSVDPSGNADGPFDPNNPFDTEVYECSTVAGAGVPQCTQTPGLIDYAVGTRDQSPPFPGITGTVRMAVLRFTALTPICHETDLVAWRTHTPPTRLSDVDGNAVYPTQISLSINDYTPPVLAGCPADVTVECDAVPPPASVTATDNCDPNVVVVYHEARTDGPCTDTYTLTRTWTATDYCGNSAGCQQTIHVHDTTKPVLHDCPADVTVECDSVPTAPTVTATDNCDPSPAVVYGEVRTDGSCADSYTLTRTWTATDRCENSDFCTQVITVRDTTEPVLNGCPTGVTVECDSVPTPPTVTGTDNCDPSPTVVYNEVRTDGPCADTYTLTRTWTATDRCGNFANCEQIIHVQDTTNPSFVSFPPDRTQDADAGLCTAVLVPPITPPTGSDNCDSAVLVEYNRSDDPNVWHPSTDLSALHVPYPAGVTTITWRATDNCAHSITQSQTVAISSYNKLVVDVHMRGNSFVVPFTRCITFELYNCSTSAQVTVESVLTFDTFTTGIGAQANGVVLDVPCGAYNCIRARDRLHTLWQTASSGHFSIGGTQFVAEFAHTGSDDDRLVNGNLNADPFIDILDFALYIHRFGQLMSGSTNCSTAGPHPNFNGDGLVDSLDFSFIQTYFLFQDDPGCCGLKADLGQPRTAISVAELLALGMPELAVADLNGDGWIDELDIVAFADGVLPEPPPPGPLPQPKPAIQIDPVQTGPVDVEPEPIVPVPVVKPGRTQTR
jgi:hypothetical protein